ncbi:uncharacterized protein B0H18DRAFT_1005573 [Fomitopsis serialis]|uniref:uncharacterized protein n=1 Tax=Fomitopsis serialis TaxID=139415 RepID=UPI0020087EA4|nr:uncharacterized protein B0H18DRAFT_1005573 [Neoantrodia serialis]KAH9926788.1 hypothetical protein B0H18DRAFT_1005573 [Neoantrodia serialis]
MEDADGFGLQSFSELPDRISTPGPSRPRPQGVLLNSKSDEDLEGFACGARSKPSLQRPLPLTLSGRIPLDVSFCTIDQLDRSVLRAATPACWTWHHRALYTQRNPRESYNLLVARVNTSPRVKERLTATRMLVVGSYMKRRSAPFLDALPAVFVCATYYRYFVFSRSLALASRAVTRDRSSSTRGPRWSGDAAISGLWYIQLAPWCSDTTRYGGCLALYMLMERAEREV